MSTTTKDRLIIGSSVAAVLILLAFFVWVFAFLAGHMLDAAHDGNTAEAVAYGFLIVIVFFTGWRSKR